MDENNYEVFWYYIFNTFQYVQFKIMQEAV